MFAKQTKKENAMRELTEEEIKDAPMSAEHYSINQDDTVKYHYFDWAGTKPRPRQPFKLSETLPIMEPTIGQLKELSAIREAKGELSDPALIVASLVHMALIKEKKK